MSTLGELLNFCPFGKGWADRGYVAFALRCSGVCALTAGRPTGRARSPFPLIPIQRVPPRTAMTARASSPGQHFGKQPGRQRHDTLRKTILGRHEHLLARPATRPAAFPPARQQPENSRDTDTEDEKKARPSSPRFSTRAPTCCPGWRRAPRRAAPGAEVVAPGAEVVALALIPPTRGAGCRGGGAGCRGGGARLPGGAERRCGVQRPRRWRWVAKAGALDSRRGGRPPTRALISLTRRRRFPHAVAPISRGGAGSQSGRASF